MTSPSATCAAAMLLLSPALAAQSEALAAHWSYDAEAPLNVRQLHREEQGGVRIYDLSYDSPVGDRGPSVGPNGGVVTAYLVLPTGTGACPVRTRRTARSFSKRRWSWPGREWRRCCRIM